MTVTVLLAVRDGMPHLPQAVESILAQTWRDFEFLILDDGSTDDTWSYLSQLTDPRLRLERQPQNLGLTATLNRGLALAKGRFIARQDADDFSHPERLRRQVELLQAYPAVGAVGAQAKIVQEAGRFAENRDLPLEDFSIRFSHLFDNALLHSAVTFRAEPVRALGGYDEHFAVSQDYDLWSRLGERTALRNLPERLVTLRRRLASITATHARPDLIGEIQAAHFARILPGPPPTPEELSLISLLRSHLTQETAAPFRTCFDQLLARFQAAHPASRLSFDFRRTLSLLNLRLGYNLLPHSRREALTFLRRALACSPQRLLTAPLVRILARFLLGARAETLHRRWQTLAA